MWQPDASRSTAPATLPTVVITSRRYEGRQDLERIEAAITASWIAARPVVGMTVGDLEWWIGQVEPGGDIATYMRTWLVDDEVVGFSWFDPPNSMDWHIRLDRWSDELMTALVDSLAAEAAAWRPPLATTVVPPTEIVTFAMDADKRTAAILRRLGWRPVEQALLSHWSTRLPRPIPEPVLPPGYRIRTLRGRHEITARVDVHRAAFAPNRMTAEKYEALVDMPHYAFDRDFVVEAPDGTLAAFTICWWDPVARVGEFEPVGTHPDHRRLGLGRAILHAGLRCFRDLGARDVLVFSGVANTASEALYADAGFERLTYHRRWVRPLDADTMRP